MRVWCGDRTNHQAPPGWHFLVADPAYAPELDGEIWLLEYTG